MKYIIEYYYPDHNADSNRSRYNIYFKRHWWSWRRVVAKGVEVEGGILGVKNLYIIPHLTSLCTVDFINHNDPSNTKKDLIF